AAGGGVAPAPPARPAGPPPAPPPAGDPTPGLLLVRRRLVGNPLICGVPPRGGDLVGRHVELRGAHRETCVDDVVKALQPLLMAARIPFMPGRAQIRARVLLVVA